MDIFIYTVQNDFLVKLDVLWNKIGFLYRHILQDKHAPTRKKMYTISLPMNCLKQKKKKILSLKLNTDVELS